MTGGHINRFGLSRTIPPDIKRQIRRECYFGCVICGSALIQYEHIEPEFSEATEHNPARMALLCGGCHDKVTRKTLSKQRVWQARQDPWCKSHGFAHDVLDLPEGPIGIHIGGNYVNADVAIMVFGQPVLWFEDPEQPGAPKRLNALFYDSNGELIARIVRNEVSTYVGKWDIESRGGKEASIRLSDSTGSLLTMRRVGGQELRIQDSKLRYRGASVDVAHDGEVTIRIGASSLKLQSSSFIGGRCAVALGNVPRDCRQARYLRCIAAATNHPIRDARGTVIAFRAGRHIVDVNGCVLAAIDGNRVFRFGTDEYIGRLHGHHIDAEDDVDETGFPVYVPRERHATALSGQACRDVTARLAAR